MLEGAGALALELKPFYAPSHVPYVLRETDSDRSSCVCGVRRAVWLLFAWQSAACIVNRAECRVSNLDGLCRSALVWVVAERQRVIILP